MVTGTTSPSTRYERISVSPASCSIKSEYVIASHAFKPQYKCINYIPAWEQRKFSDVAMIKRGLTYSPTDIVDGAGGIRVLRSSNINEDQFVLNNDDVFVNEGAVTIDLVHDGDILITAANGSPRLVGKRARISDLPGKTVQGGFMLVASSPCSDFLCASMGSSWYRRFLATGVAGGNGAIGNLDSKALGETTIAVPNDAEKDKIGCFFTRLDSLITLHQRKRQWLKWLDEGGEGTHHDIDILVFKFADDMKISVLCGVHACMTKSLGHTGNRYAGKQQQRGMGVP